MPHAIRGSMRKMGLATRTPSSSSWRTRQKMLASAESLVQGIAGVVNRTSRGITALHLTALFGLTEITTELLGGHQNPNVMALQGRTPLPLAAERGFDVVVNLSLEAGADVDLVETRSCTPLWYAADNGHAAVVRALLKTACDVTHRPANPHHGEQLVQTISTSLNSSFRTKTLASNSKTTSSTQRRSRRLLFVVTSLL